MQDLHRYTVAVHQVYCNVLGVAATVLNDEGCRHHGFFPLLWCKEKKVNSKQLDKENDEHEENCFCISKISWDFLLFIVKLH